MYETKILLSWQLAIFVIFLLLDVNDGVHQLQIFLFVHTLWSSFSTSDGGVHCPSPLHSFLCSYYEVFQILLYLLAVSKGSPFSPRISLIIYLIRRCRRNYKSPHFTLDLGYLFLNFTEGIINALSFFFSFQFLSHQ